MMNSILMLFSAPVALHAIAISHATQSPVAALHAITISRATRSRSRCVTSAVLAPLYPELQVDSVELQAMLQADISRRSTELLALGWLGRAYLLTPGLCRALLPGIFRLEPYGAAAPCFVGSEGMVVTLRESSVGGPKGIPFLLRFDRADVADAATSVQLLGVGCDVSGGQAARAAGEEGRREMSEADVRVVCEALEADADAKRRVVQAITSTLFRSLQAVSGASRRQVELEACSEVRSFTPREETYGLEGSSYKWLQQVSGYYFAASRLQEVRFDTTAPLGAVRFTFYLDPEEPLNSDDPRRIINPEVVLCMF